MAIEPPKLYRELLNRPLDDIFKEIRQNQAAESDAAINPNMLMLEVENFIYVPSINLYVAKEISLLGRNWEDCHAELQINNKIMLTIPEFWAFVNYLKNGYDDKIEAHEILNSIFKVGILRAEWLDAQFEEKGKEIYMNFRHEFQYGKLIPRYTEILEECVMEDCFVALGSINKQGLPSRGYLHFSDYIEGRNIYFKHPTNKKTSVFVVGPYWAGLRCDLDDSNCGVRECFEGGEYD